MADHELDWDHAADFGESSPLLEGTKDESSAYYRSGNLSLSFDEARELIGVLDSCRTKLEQYISPGEESQSQIIEVEVTAGRCLRFKTKIGPKIARNIIFVTILLQAVNVLVLSLIDIWPKKDSETVIVVSAVTMLVFQLLNLFCLIYTTVDLAKQLYKRSVSNILLAQCYLATILLFCGIYILTYRLKPESWKFIQDDLNKSPDLVIVLYVKILFFSVSTATLCGTANVVPAEWYNYIFTSFQMLLSFVYFASILGQSIASHTSRVTKNTTTTRTSTYGATTNNDDRSYRNTPGQEDYLNVWPSIKFLGQAVAQLVVVLESWLHQTNGGCEI
ncbi:hypothetical protein LOTGIDRAFT_236330, partial [Lottia gigantea]